MPTLSRQFYFLLFLTFLLATTSCRSHKDLTTSHEKEKTTVSGSKNIQTKYAGLLNVGNDKIDNLSLYSFINEWYGVPYKYGGQNKKGIDCSNFTSVLYNQVYHISLTGTSASIFDQCKVISKNNLTEGDMVFFKIEKDNISHIGVYLQNNKFVHATTKKGVMIDDLDEPYYKKYFYKGGRLK